MRVRPVQLYSAEAICMRGLVVLVVVERDLIKKGSNASLFYTVSKSTTA